MIDSDSLIIVIDMHDDILDDVPQAWWRPYYRKNMGNLLDMLKHCNASGIPVQEARYYKERNRELEDIKFDYTVSDELVYSRFNAIYFCGIAIDQCVVNRSSGYFRVRNRNKFVVTNCSFLPPKTAIPIDYLPRGIAYKEVLSLHNMADLEDHLERFLEVNQINAVAWERV